MGDEPLNPYLPGYKLAEVLGCPSQDVDTKALYKEVTEKFDVYHIAITNDNCYSHYKDEIKQTWGALLGQHLLTGTSDQLPQLISQIIEDHENNYTNDTVVITEEGIGW